MIRCVMHKFTPPVYGHVRGLYVFDMRFSQVAEAACARPRHTQFIRYYQMLQLSFCISLRSKPFAGLFAFSAPLSGESGWTELSTTSDFSVRPKHRLAWDQQAPFRADRPSCDRTRRSILYMLVRENGVCSGVYRYCCCFDLAASTASALCAATPSKFVAC